MCYFLYGGVNKGINIEDYKKYSRNSLFFFAEGTESDIKHCIKECKDDYRITKNYCDCGTALGSHMVDKEELKELGQYINQLRKVKGIKHIFISKNWWEEETQKELTIHIDDVDIIDYLANIEDNCLYKIQLFKIHY